MDYELGERGKGCSRPRVNAPTPGPPRPDLLPSMRSTFLRGLPKARPRSAVGKEALERPRALVLPPFHSRGETEQICPPTPNMPHWLWFHQPCFSSLLLPLRQSPKVKRREGACFKHLLCVKHCVGYLIPCFISPLPQPCKPSIYKQETHQGPKLERSSQSWGVALAHRLQSHLLSS